ncbi:hypothetical protein VTL71DRAFT_13236 [Oculimacula yallundae]|uniref:Uncharacterized protein n=1 Tax=Oculimacula yallundae TaxID=86028 RepID=A0ABR4CKA8_9HELO
MRAPTWQVTAVILVTAILQCISASECGPNDTLFHSQEEVEKILAGCTVWVGDLEIAFNWNGPFELSNITNITGSLITGMERYASAPPVASSLTSVKAPVLKTIRDLSLWNTPLLASASFPKLEQMRNMAIGLDSPLNPRPEVTLEMTSLVNASEIRVMGNFPRLTFPSLLEIKNGLYIADNRNRSSESYGLDPVPVNASNIIAIDLPVLRQVHEVQILGPISNLSMPSLEIVNEWGNRSQYEQDLIDLVEGLKIYAVGEPLSVTFPALRNVTDVNLSGNIKQVSFPALLVIDGRFSLESNTNMAFDSKPLQQVKEMQLARNVTNYNVDSLLSVDRMTINTLEGVDCDPARAVWTRSHPDYDPDKYDDNYYCNSKIATPKKKKAFPALPVGLSIGIGVPVWLFFMFALWHSRKAKKQAEEVAKIPPPDYDAEMAARSAGGGEVLPDYEPRRSQGSGSQPGSVIELVDMARPSPHPPRYDEATVASVEVVPAGVDSMDGHGRVEGDATQTGTGH